MKKMEIVIVIADDHLDHRSLNIKIRNISRLSIPNNVLKSLSEIKKFRDSDGSTTIS